MDYRLIALDIDGTLLNSALELTPGVRNALRRASDAGKHIVAATGRCIGEMESLLPELPEVRYLICENGSCICDLQTRRSLFTRTLDPQDVRRLLAVPGCERAVLLCYSDNRMYFQAADDAWLEPCGMGRYREAFRRAGTYDAHLFDDYDTAPFPVEKIGYYFDNEADQLRVAAELEAMGFNPMHSMAHVLEVVPDSADKGVALKVLCARLGIDDAQSIAAGDSENDLPMLRAAGLAAAMGNAMENVKAEADVVCPDCDHDGVAWLIGQYML